MNENNVCASVFVRMTARKIENVYGGIEFDNKSCDVFEA